MDQLCCWKIFLITLSDPLLPLSQDSNAEWKYFFLFFFFFFSSQHWFSSFALLLCKLTTNTPLLQCWIIMKLYVFSHPVMPALESESCLAWHCCWGAIQCVHNQGGRLSWWTVVSREGFWKLRHDQTCQRLHIHKFHALAGSYAPHITKLKHGCSYWALSTGPAQMFLQSNWTKAATDEKF